ncbi:hypothetical protein ATKI12_7535 [Kitasatospora sp. Ki12]
MSDRFRPESIAEGTEPDRFLRGRHRFGRGSIAFASRTNLCGASGPARGGRGGSRDGRRRRGPRNRR